MGIDARLLAMAGLGDGLLAAKLGDHLRRPG
jgi:hypothetical protein